MSYKDLTKEQKKVRSEYMKKYRREHPEYMAAQRIRERPHMERYRVATQRKFKEKIIREWIKGGMIVDGCKIDITHFEGEKIETNRKMITTRDMVSSEGQVMKYVFERMLKELGL